MTQVAQVAPTSLIFSIAAALLLGDYGSLGVWPSVLEAENVPVAAGGQQVPAVS